MVSEALCNIGGLKHACYINVGVKLLYNSLNCRVHILYYCMCHSACADVPQCMHVQMCHSACLCRCATVHAVA